MSLDSTTSYTWPQILTDLLAHRDLTADQTAWAMGQILAGDATPSQIAGFAVALRSKGETVAEVEGLVSTMYAYATPLSVSGRVVDIVGTGGDRAHTVNISTMAAIVAAAAGARVVKHGNRAASSACGSADVLEELGLPLDLSPDRVAMLAHEIGITFCFAPVFHPALRHSAIPRRELGVGTTFNFLGPLANPARPAAQAVGVADSRMAEITAGVLARRGVDALVFRGDDGLDELTTTATSRVWTVRDGVVESEKFDPSALGISRAQPRDLVGGSAAFNADVVRSVLAGQAGPVRDAVALNAGAALAVLEGGGGRLNERLKSGMARALGALETGSAAALLEQWIVRARS
jgi:anthranilate phosphoribosyltransferase